MHELAGIALQAARDAITFQGIRELGVTIIFIITMIGIIITLHSKEDWYPPIFFSLKYFCIFILSLTLYHQVDVFLMIFNQEAYIAYKLLLRSVINV